MNIVQRPFSLKELKHGEQAKIRPKEYRAKAVLLEGAQTWQASNNQAEGISCKSRSARRSSNMASKRQSGWRNINRFSPWSDKKIDIAVRRELPSGGMKSILAMRQRKNWYRREAWIAVRRMKSIFAVRQRRNRYRLEASIAVRQMKSIFAVRQRRNWYRREA